MRGKLSDILINSRLPAEHRISGRLNTSNLKRAMVGLAKRDPAAYAKAAPKIKKLGDEFSTFEGISVGLDDIEPEYSKRDPIINKAKRLVFNPTATKKAKVGALLEAQGKLKELTGQHKGDMAMTARSGSRGNMVQLMKMVTSPVVVGDFDGAPVPFLIQKGYSEGVSPAEGWIAGDESRAQVIKGQLGTAEPGEMQKVLASVMSEGVIAKDDCGTTNGISLDSNDASIEGRYLPGTGGYIDSTKAAQLMRSGKPIKVRSPMTCALDRGVCQRCMGAGPRGKPLDIGVNAGIRSAQALSEPLTQMQLSAKHGVSLVQGDHNIPRGLKAFKQFVEVPKAFFYKAPLAESGGRVDSVEKAPQGGFDVKIGGIDHYVPPNRKLLIKKGTNVEAGDTIAEGIASPDEVVRHKGLGHGRNYLVKSLRKVYDESAGGVDPRHIELLARTQLNYAEVVDDVPGANRGDILPLHRISKHFQGRGTETDLNSAIGKVITESASYVTPGTLLTKRVVEDLKKEGISKVKAYSGKPVLRPVMTSASRTPLLNPNWMQRLGYRYQKQTLIDAATFGQKGDIHTYDPVAALAFGKELRRGSGGTY